MHTGVVMNSIAFDFSTLPAQRQRSTPLLQAEKRYGATQVLAQTLTFNGSSQFQGAIKSGGVPI